MTTEPPTPTGPENQHPRPPTPGTTTPSLGGMCGEMMVMVSGTLILGVHVIFGLIADQWCPSFLSVVAGTFATPSGEFCGILDQRLDIAQGQRDT
jgi:hypothetical protein